MMSTRITILFFVHWLLLSTFLNEVRAQIIANEFIVEYHGDSFEKLCTDISKSGALRSDTPFSWKKLGTLLPYYLLKVDESESLLWETALGNNPSIPAFEHNSILEKRLKPNDPRLGEQWHLETIKMDESWDVVIGGNDPGGRQIVIALMDGGFHTGHEDLQDIFYKNTKEVPGDGIDNDGNLYTDDYNGWNVKKQNDLITSDSHGTSVVGMAAANANNGKGIAGMDWGVKILPIVEVTNSGEVVQAYEYILAQRKLYNQTNGAKGAYIVAASYSGGLPNAFGTSFPIWCGLYDKLGQAGIISIGATANDDVNVDIKGDMPSTCTSPYLIVVTNTNAADKKERYAGYGPIHVDIGVPGEEILTTDLDSRGKYRVESGTSLSAPVLAGAISLMYALPCEPFFQLAKSNPSVAASSLVDIFLQSGDANSTLSGITSTGKRLNVLNAISALRLAYDNCINLPSPRGALAINNITYLYGGNTFLVDYLTPDEKPVQFVISDATGRQVRSEEITPPLFGNKTYAFSVNSSLNNSLDIAVHGIYFISLIRGNEVVSKSVFIKP